MRLPISVILHTRVGCPYCETLEKFLLEPLESMDIIRVRRVYIDQKYGGSMKSLNWLVSEHMTEGKVDVAPILFVRNPKREDSLYDIIASYDVGDDLSVEETVAVMGFNFIHYLYKQFGISPDTLLEHPNVAKIMEWYRRVKKKMK